MSDSLTAERPQDEPYAGAPRRGFFARRDPLLPEAGAGGAPLTAVIGVISFLAAIAMAALLIINKTTGEWTASLRSEITVQVKGVDTAEIDARVIAAIGVLEKTDGVLSVNLISQEEAADLLEPWLGAGNAAAFLNIPAIIEVTIDPALRDNLDVLADQVRAVAPSAGIDDHRGWHDRLSKAARSGQALALVVFLLVMGAACAVSMFAARAGLAANHEIVSVLHLVGAADDFIAAEVQRRFFVLGLRGAIAGVAAAIAAVALAALAAQSNVGAENFMPQFTLSGWLIFWLGSVPIIICLVTAITARLTVLKTLREQY